jgi:hypothetical protein
MLPAKRGEALREPAHAVLWLVLAAGLGAWAAAGQAPPPASLDAKGVDDWRKANIQAEGWVLLHADGAALSYGGGPNGVRPDKDGFLHADVRREYYRTVRVGPGPSRSNLQTWVLDCELRRLRVTSMNFYALNNLQGTGFRKSAEEASWTTLDAGSQNTPEFDRICAAAPKPR